MEKQSRNGRTYKTLWAGIFTACLLGGCTSNQPCVSLECIKKQAAKEAAKPYFSACMRALHRYEHYSRKNQEVIRREYPYVYTSSRSAASWQMMGNHVEEPPHQFCDRYSKRKVRETL